MRGLGAALLAYGLGACAHAGPQPDGGATHAAQAPLPALEESL